MRDTFAVPTLPHLKKYVEKKFFAGQLPPFKVNENTIIGKQFMSVLIDKRQNRLRGDNHVKMTASILFRFSEELSKRSPRISKLVNINFYLHKLFKEELICWILSAQVHGTLPFPSSKNFLDFYGIEEGEYTHRAAYHHWMGWHKEIRNVPSFMPSNLIKNKLGHFSH